MTNIANATIAGVLVPLGLVDAIRNSRNDGAFQGLGFFVGHPRGRPDGLALGPHGVGVPGGIGGLGGVLFSKNASDAAVKWIEFFNSTENQAKYAKDAYYIPIAKGAADNMTNPFKIQIAQNIGNAHWHALFFDQALGPAVGGVVNDVSAELAANSISAEEAAQLVKEAVDDAHVTVLACGTEFALEPFTVARNQREQAAQPCRHGRVGRPGVLLGGPVGSAVADQEVEALATARDALRGVGIDDEPGRPRSSWTGRATRSGTLARSSHSWAWGFACCSGASRPPCR